MYFLHFAQFNSMYTLEAAIPHHTKLVQDTRPSTHAPPPTHAPRLEALSKRRPHARPHPHSPAHPAQPRAGVSLGSLSVGERAEHRDPVVVVPVGGDVDGDDEVGGGAGGREQ